MQVTHTSLENCVQRCGELVMGSVSLYKPRQFPLGSSDSVPWPLVSLSSAKAFHVKAKPLIIAWKQKTQGAWFVQWVALLHAELKERGPGPRTMQKLWTVQVFLKPGEATPAMDFSVFQR